MPLLYAPALARPRVNCRFCVSGEPTISGISPRMGDTPITQVGGKLLAVCSELRVSTGIEGVRQNLPQTCVKHRAKSRSQEAKVFRCKAGCAERVHCIQDTQRFLDIQVIRIEKAIGLTQRIGDYPSLVAFQYALTNTPIAAPLADVTDEFVSIIFGEVSIDQTFALLLEIRRVGIFSQVLSHQTGEVIKRDRDSEADDTL